MPITELSILAVIVAANSAPILASRLFRHRWAAPLDRGRVLADGQPLFGPSKTWRGLAAALATSTAAAVVLGLGWPLGLLAGACAMLGDLYSSFVKRRLRLASSTRALGLDQIPESLFPLLACAPLLELDWIGVAVLTLAFTVLELLLSRLAFRLGLRRHPY
jgi:CDP-2,3-bis-(O-geranylgeranyl)-sn-glycerol synthase